MKKESLLNLLIIILGNLILAIGTSIFILPNNIVSGGMSGVGVVLNSLFDFNPSTVIFVLAWFFFFLGLIFLGKIFAFKTLTGTIVYPVFVQIIYNNEFFNSLSGQVTNGLLAAIAGGVLMGFGMGIIFRVGGSSGGFDVLSLILNKYFRIKISKATLIIDTIIIIFAFVVLSLENILLGLICATITSYLIEKVVVGNSNTLTAHIISDKYELVNEYILKEIGRGTTVIEVRGGYSKEEKNMIKVVFDKRQYHYLKKGIHSIDENAFMSVFKVIDVFGDGFSKMF